MWQALFWAIYMYYLSYLLKLSFLFSNEETEVRRLNYLLSKSRSWIYTQVAGFYIHTLHQ